MPLPTIAIPASSGLLRAYVGCMKLLSGTKQWQKETGRDEVGAADRIFFPEFPSRELIARGLPENSLPVPLCILSRPVAMPYYRGHGETGGSDHYYGAIMMNLILPENPAYSTDHVNRWSDQLARHEVNLQEMRDLRNTQQITDPNFNYWNFTTLTIAHRSDNDTGEVSEVGEREDGQAWKIVDWNGEPLALRAYTSSWILDFGY